MSNNSHTAIWETWESILLKSTVLGHKIAADAQAQKIEITRIAFVPRGGLFIVNVIARQLSLSGDQVLSLGISRYNREHPSEEGEFKIGQLPFEHNVQGHVVLLVDEVHDTGKTTEFAKHELLKLGAKKVFTAAVHYKPNKSMVETVPDYYVEATDGWVHYPWEVIDEIGTIHKKFMQQ